MSSEQHRMVILVNTETGYAFPTKNNHTLEHIDSYHSAKTKRQDFYKTAVAKGGSTNYQSWADDLRTSGYENFFAVVVKGETELEVKEQVLKIMKDNGWENARKIF